MQRYFHAKLHKLVDLDPKVRPPTMVAAVFRAATCLGARLLAVSSPFPAPAAL